MAKMYYNQEETLAKLGISEEELREMIRGGKIREFRDAGKLNYRIEEVDKLASGGSKSNVLGSDTSELGVDAIAEIALSPSEADKALSGSSLPGLSGSGSGAALSKTGSAPGLSGSDANPPINLEGSGISLGLGGSTTELRLEDSATALTSSGTTELRLEDSGAPAAEKKPGGTDAVSLDEVDKDAIRGMKKDDTVITNIGISVFDEEDIEIAADPMAKTLMTGGTEHLGLDGSGGGSGLLDLTRECDDTSLGAELLEGIDMGDTAETLAQSVQQDSSQNEPPMPVDSAPLAESPIAPVLVPMSMVPVEPLSPMFTAMLIAAVVVLGLAGATSIAISLDTWPSYLAMLGELFPWSLIGTVVLGGLFALVGFLIGRSAQKGPRPPKPPKEKKVKEPKEKTAKGKKGDAVVAAAKG